MMGPYLEEEDKKEEENKKTVEINKVVNEQKVKDSSRVSTLSNHADTQESEKGKDRKEKNRPPTKIVIRRLPPSMNEETFLAQVEPLPDFDHMYFVRADMSLGPNAFSRAYINITNEEDIFTFKEKFDNYIFVDKKVVNILQWLNLLHTNVCLRKYQEKTLKLVQLKKIQVILLI